jgi:predicted lipoprotein with Yx(FWY)xxD motif
LSSLDDLLGEPFLGRSVKRLFFMTMPMLVTSLTLAACGSSSQTTTSSSASASPASSTTASGGGGGAYGGGGGYGSGSGSGSSSSSSSGGAPAASSATVQVSTKHSKLGPILAAGPKQLTVYLFEGDKGAASACSGACASVWPPVTTSAKATAHGQAVTAELGTISRSGGIKQVTYNGHPLYYFVRDKDSGDAYGQGVKAFGAGWYVLAPSGKKIDNS